MRCKSNRWCAFLSKCGAELKVDNAGSVTAEKSVRADLQKRNTVEPVSEGDIYDLLWKSAANRPEIKKVDYQQRAGITMLKGKRNRYFVGGSGGAYKLSVSPRFSLSIHRIIFLFTIVLTVTFLVKGFDLEEIYPLLGWCLLIGGVGGIVSEAVCRGEKKEIVTFIKKVLSKAVCVKEPVSPIFEPLSSHPGLWFLGFSLPVASVIEPIIYSLAALAGAVLLISGSGVLDNTGFSGYNEPHYDTYDDESETDRYMSSSDTDNVLLEYEYINEDEGFSFMYPYNWEIEDVEDVNPDALVSVACTGMLGTYARITVEKDIDDGFCFDATEADFEEVFSATEGLSNVKVMDLSDIELDGYPARKLTTAFNNDAGVRVIVIQYFYSRGSYLYVVNCAVEEYDYDSYEPRFNAIMGSYTITAANEAALSFDTSEI